MKLNLRFYAALAVVSLMGTPTFAQTTVTRTVATGTDDAEQASSGSVSLNSKDLDFGDQAYNGMRFTGLSIPAGSTVQSATVQFRAKGNLSSPATFTVFGQAADNAGTFRRTSGNLNTRPRTAVSVDWAPPAWSSGAKTAAQRTPDLSAIVQEIIDRPGWTSGNAVVLFVDGLSGKREAYAYNGDRKNPPTLTVTYTETPPSCPAVGTPCSDGDSSTENDVEDGNCSCSGTPTTDPGPDPDPKPDPGFTPNYSSTGEDLLTLTHRWSRMGDLDGVYDVDLGTGEAGLVSVETAQFSPDESVVITTAKSDYSIRLFDVATGDQLWVKDGTAETECAAFTADGQFVVTGSEAQPEIRIWRVSDGALVRSIDDNVSVEGMVFSPDYSLLACGNDAGEIRLYSTSDPNPLNWPATPAYVLYQGPDQSRGGSGNSDVNQMHWTPDGAYLFSAGRNALVKQWETARFGEAGGGFVRDFTGHEGSIKSVELSPDGTLLASCSNWRTGNTGRDVEARVIVHDPATGQQLINFVIPNGKVPEVVTFDPRGQVLLAGSSFDFTPETESVTYVWRTTSVRAGRAQPEQTFQWYEQEYIDFKDDNSALLIGGSDGSVRLFDMVIDTTSSAPATPPTTTQVPPFSLEAEEYSAQQNITPFATGIGYCDNNDWVRFDGVDFKSGYDRLTVRYAKGNSSTSDRAEFRLDGVNGPLIGTFTLTNTGAWSSYRDATIDLTGAEGMHDLYIVFRGGGGVGNFDVFSFAGPQVQGQSLATDSKLAATSLASSPELQLFPNPTAGELWIDATGGDRLEVRDLVGRLLLHRNLDGTTSRRFRLQLPTNAPTGTLLVTLSGKTGSATRRVVKR